MSERMVKTDGADLCTESFGDPSDPAVLLIMGIGGSMLWWDEELCERIAGEGRYVIRYDHRDTGRSTAYEPGKPGYDGADLARDAIAVLDGHGIGSAHIAGLSAGGGMAQEVALWFPDRIDGLTLISTTSATGGGPDLPPPTEAFGEWVESASVDWADDSSIVDYLTSYSRLLNGEVREFDEKACRGLVRREIDRARDIATLQNHDVMDHGDGSGLAVSGIAAPTHVIHGSEDPMFPPPHGEALAEQIPGAGLTILEGAGHGVFREDWDALVPAIASS